MPGLLPKLVDMYGQSRVVDVFEGTGLAGLAQQHGFGGYVVRSVLPQEQVARWHDELDRFMVRYAFDNGNSSVELKGASCGTVRCSALVGYAHASTTTRARPGTRCSV